MEENDKCWYECKKHQAYEKHYVWNPVTCSCEYGKYLASIVDDSAITCDEVIESHDEKTITIPTNFNEKKQPLKRKLLLLFLLVTIALLITVIIYGYVIKYQAKQKHLLSNHFTDNELKLFG